MSTENKCIPLAAEEAFCLTLAAETAFKKNIKWGFVHTFLETPILLAIVQTGLVVEQETMFVLLLL